MIFRSGSFTADYHGPGEVLVVGEGYRLIVWLNGRRLECVVLECPTQTLFVPPGIEKIARTLASRQLSSRKRKKRKKHNLPPQVEQPDLF